MVEEDYNPSTPGDPLETSDKTEEEVEDLDEGPAIVVEEIQLDEQNYPV
jgi:hypothetical protein